MNQYISTNIPAEKSHFLKALACSKDIFTLQRFLDKTLDKSQVKILTIMNLKHSSIPQNIFEKQGT